MAKIAEVRLGPLDTPRDLVQAIRQLTIALNRLIQAFNQTQED